MQDALALGFRANVVWDLTRPVTPQSDAATRATLERLGVGIVPAAEFQ